MKYRILRDNELRDLEPQLKHFLIVNGVHDDEWKRINSEDPDKAIELVQIFSDNMLQRFYESIEYLEKRTADRCFLFRCQQEKIEMITFSLANKDAFDITNTDEFQQALADPENFDDYVQGQKVYTVGREQEIHAMMEQGHRPIKGDLWEFFSTNLKKTQNDSIT
ncbi:MAG: DUF6495 family protein [Bacteroidota bacterium]